MEGEKSLRAADVGVIAGRSVSPGLAEGELHWMVANHFPSGESGSEKLQCPRLASRAVLRASIELL